MMNFGEALRHLREGNLVSRREWGGQKFLVWVPGDEWSIGPRVRMLMAHHATGDHEDFIGVKAVDRPLVPLTAILIEDVKADDWEAFSA